MDSVNNVLINGVTAVCLVALIVQAAAWFVMLFCRGRTKDIEFLESFKKGQFAIVYLTAIPLYIIGFMYSGKDFVKAFFSSVSKIIELVVLKYDFDCIEPLMDNNSFYKVTVFICFAMAGLNIVFVALSVLSRRIWEFLRKNKIRYCPKDRIFIFGNNPRSLDIYTSDTERNKIIIDDISSEDCERYFKENISYLADTDEDAVDEIFKKRPFAVFRRKIYERAQKDSTDSRNMVIINTENDERNMRICRRMIEEIESRDDEGKEELFKTLRIFVFGDLAYEAIYEDIESDGCGCITFINKYKKIASDFIERYPLAYFMTDKQIDYETSLVKDDVDINFFMVCFGNVSRQTLLTSVSNNQFLTKGENGRPEVKRVKYYIFDKAEARCNKNLNHSYYRYRDEKDTYDPTEYLPLPSLPADEVPYCIDINNEQLYAKIKECVQGKNDANFVFISFGNDLENIDMAQKLVAKRREWGKDFVIFVRTHTRSKEQEKLEREGCLFIGNEKEIVYNIDKILSDRIQKIAIARNEEYDLEDAISKQRKDNPDFVVTDEFVAAEKYKSFKNWHSDIHRLMRESNIYAALSIRAKLNLMGLDYCEVGANDKEALREDEYLEIYAKNDMPKYSGKKANCGRKIIEHSIDFRNSRRRNMAILEHYRWNAYLISKGFVPATLQQIKEEETVVNGKSKHTNGRSYVLRRHGNLTTFDGLIQYRELVAKRDNCKEEDCDVIKYDYQILDDLHYFLTKGGYKIVKK